MASFFTKLKNLVSETVDTVFETDKPAKAAIGGAIYVAKAGGMSEKEFKALVEQVRGNPAFSGADVDGHAAFWEAYKSDRTFKLDLMAMLNEVGAEENEVLRKKIAIICIEVADAEGEDEACECSTEDKISPEEMKRLKEVGAAININIEALI